MSGTEPQKSLNGCSMCWIFERHSKDQIMDLHNLVPVSDLEIYCAVALFTFCFCHIHPYNSFARRSCTSETL